MNKSDLVALDDSAIELSSPAGLSEFAPAPTASDVESDSQIEEVKCRACGHVDAPAWCDDHSGYRITHEPDCNYVIFEDDCDCAASEHVEARA